MKNSKTFRFIFLLAICLCVSLSCFSVGAYALTTNYPTSLSTMSDIKLGSNSIDIRFQDTLGAYGGYLPSNSMVIAVPRWYNSQGFIPYPFYSEIIHQDFFGIDENGNRFTISDYGWRGNPCWQTKDIWTFQIYVQDYIVDGCKVKFLTVDAIYTANSYYSRYVSSPINTMFYFGDKDSGYSSMIQYPSLSSNNENSTYNFILNYMQNWIPRIDTSIETRYTHLIGPISLFQGAHFDTSSIPDDSSSDNIFNIDMSGASCNCSGGSSNCECGYYWDKLQDIFGEDLSGLNVLNENVSNMTNQIQNIQQNLNQVYNVIVGSPAPSEPSTDENGNPITTTNPIGNLDGFTDSDYSFEAPDLESVKPVLSDIFGSFPAPIVAGISLICVVLLALKILSR